MAAPRGGAAEHTGLAADPVGVTQFAPQAACGLYTDGRGWTRGSRGCGGLVGGNSRVCGRVWPKRWAVRRSDAGALDRRADAADEIVLLAPQVQGAAVVLGGEGELRRAHVEEHATVFEHDRAGVLGEEGLECGGDLLGGLGWRGCWR